MGLACVYAALILADDDVPVTADRITSILKAAGVDFEPYWPGLFAKALESCDLKDLITKIGSGAGAAPAAGGAAAPAAGVLPPLRRRRKNPSLRKRRKMMTWDSAF